MSIFLAIVPPQEAVGSLRAAIAGAQGPADDAGRLNWAPVSHWHITLAFYGSDDDTVVAARLREDLPCMPAPALRLAGAGTFPSVLWAGVAEAHATGQGALRELAAAARGAGARSEQREYRAHLTLAKLRGRSRKPGDTQLLGQWLSALGDYQGPAWTAAHAVLMRSEYGSSGARYRELETFEFSLGGKVAG